MHMHVYICYNNIYYKKNHAHFLLFLFVIVFVVFEFEFELYFIIFFFVFFSLARKWEKISFFCVCVSCIFERSVIEFFA